MVAQFYAHILRLRKYILTNKLRFSKNKLTERRGTPNGAAQARRGRTGGREPPRVPSAESLTRAGARRQGRREVQRFKAGPAGRGTRTNGPIM